MEGPATRSHLQRFAEQVIISAWAGLCGSAATTAVVVRLKPNLADGVQFNQYGLQMQIEFTSSLISIPPLLQEEASILAWIDLALSFGASILFKKGSNLGCKTVVGLSANTARTCSNVTIFSSSF